MTRPTDSDYARAEQMLGPHRARRVPGSRIRPQWFDDGARFCYRVGTRYVVVDPSAGTRRDGFDHHRLAAALSVRSGRAVSGDDLPLSAVEFDPQPGVVRFTAFEERWEWSDGDGTCARIDDGGLGPFDNPSPDGRWVAFGRDGDVHVRSREGAQEFALTDDATPWFDYGSMPDSLGLRALQRTAGLPPFFGVIWSPDSTRFLVHRVDQRDLPEQVLVESAPPGGGRPVEHRLRYPMAGDDAVATFTWNVADVAARTLARQSDGPDVWMHPAVLTHARWTGEKGDAVHFLHQSRDGRTLRLRRMDPVTGETGTLISETGATRVDPAVQLGEAPMWHLCDTGEIVWWSRRDGWGHLYRYSADGDSCVPITSGPWLVRSLLWVDDDRGQVWFLACGLVDGDPYARQICRVDLDGTGFTRLTDDDLDHDAVAPPEGGYLVDRASTPARPPRSRVLDPDGRVVVELEAPDPTALEEIGWTPPERFRVTAADGRTPIFGLLWRPHGFDPQRRYPVVDSIYPGPQVHRAGPAFDTVLPGEAESLAALGFAVVAVDGRGTPGRGRAFHDHSWGALDDAGSLVDHVAAIRELGLRHSWLDTSRVGITGHSGGGFATARALLAHPEFYSVGVASAGNHDMAMYVPMWPEWYHGEIDDDARRALSNPGLAANLRGRLLLIQGELDDNVLPAHTLRLVDALIDAGADVDMLLVPGADHGMRARLHWVTRQRWNYLVRHLHGGEPPAHRLAPLPQPDPLEG